MFYFTRAEEVVNSLYPEWDVLQDSVDFPTVGILEPALAVVDSKCYVIHQLHFNILLHVLFVHENHITAG